MFKSLKTAVVCLVLGVGVSYALSAQTDACRGTVQDPQGEPVIAASVLIKGGALSTGVITDFDGTFVQPNAKRGDVLVISCIGYETAEVAWNGSPLTVVLRDDANMLEETVVTAYGGRTLRSKLTNSISTVKNETLASGMHNQAAASLAGAVAGLRVQQTTGNPTSTPTMILRGGTGLDGSGSPLVIVDGAQRSLSDINPNDIESLEVLKDAGATAIYGARAANGVILVTTKRGQEGTSAINVHVKTSINKHWSPYEFLGSEEYLKYMRTAYWRSSHVTELSEGNWRSYVGLSGVSSRNPFGTGNAYFDADGHVIDGREDARGLWGVFNYSDDLAFLLESSDWGRMTDPLSQFDESFANDLIFWKGAATHDINIKDPTVSQDYGVDFQGGNDKGRYYASLGYTHVEGAAVGNEYDRLSFVFNGDYKIRPWLTSNSSFNYIRTDEVPILNGNNEAYYFTRAFTVPPTMRIYNSRGEFNPSARGGITDAAVALYNDAVDYDYNTNQFTMSQAFTVTFTPWLNLRVNGSWYYVDTWHETFTHDYLSSAGTYTTTRRSYDYYNNGLTQTYNAVLNFNKTFGQIHNVSAMAGTEFVSTWNKGFDAEGRLAATDEFQDLALTQLAYLTDSGEASSYREIDSWHGGNRVLSFFGKGDYDYDGKYLLSAVLRYDGYSRLAKESRWGVFPGVSGGWVFSKEPFMAPLRDVVSFAKLRASYGANGVLASSIGNYTVQGAYSASSDYHGQSSTTLSTLPMTAVRWEKSWTREIGLDLGLWQNRLNVNVSYYNRHTSDKIASITIPSHTGYTGVTSNLGELQNRGFEFDINARVVNTGDWKFNVGLNGAYNRNKIIKLPDNGNENNAQNAYQVYVPGSYDAETGESRLMWVGGYQEGQTPGDIYGFQALGIYRSYDEIPGNLVDKTSGNNNSTGVYLYGPDAWKALKDEDKANAFPIQPGDVIWKDVNGDGVIDDYDRVKLGNAVPKWTGGFTLNASWKGLSLTGRFDYALDYKVVDNMTPWILGNMQGTFNTIGLVRDTYDPLTGKGSLPTYVFADQNGKRNYARANNSLFVYEGSYLAIREISLSYALPESLLRYVKMQKASLYLSGQNLGYLSEAARKMGNPEYGASSYGVYPLPRTYILGLNITF